MVYLEYMTEGDEDYLERNAAAVVPDPLAALEDANMRALLVRSIEALPERERLMMALYYEQDLNLREIGEVMGVTESRVCQMHTQAVARLRVAVLGNEASPLNARRRGRKAKVS